MFVGTEADRDVESLWKHHSISLLRRKEKIRLDASRLSRFTRSRWSVSSRAGKWDGHMVRQWELAAGFQLINSSSFDHVTELPVHDSLSLIALLLVIGGRIKLSVKHEYLSCRQSSTSAMSFRVFSHPGDPHTNLFFLGRALEELFPDLRLSFCIEQHVSKSLEPMMPYMSVRETWCV